MMNLTDLPDFATAAAKSLQSCPTLWDPMDYSPPGASVHGILQARILGWVAMPSSRVFALYILLNLYTELNNCPLKICPHQIPGTCGFLPYLGKESSQK